MPAAKPHLVHPQEQADPLGSAMGWLGDLPLPSALGGKAAGKHTEVGNQFGRTQSQTSSVDFRYMKQGPV